MFALKVRPAVAVIYQVSETLARVGDGFLGAAFRLIGDFEEVGMMAVSGTKSSGANMLQKRDKKESFAGNQ